jgi:hypothetical protein
MARELRDKTKPTALACALLEDGGRALFLVRRDAQGREKLELPNALVFPGDDPAATATGALRVQAGIDGYSKGEGFEARHNAGSRRNKAWVPVLVFRMDAKNKSARPAGGLSAKWVPLDAAKSMPLGRSAEWLRLM